MELRIYHGLPPKKDRKKNGQFSKGNACNKSVGHPFKAGRKPWNEVPNGTEKLRLKSGKFYWFKKINGRWIPKHKWVWEMAYGKVKTGKVIGFKNRDSKDCSLENLYQTSRADLMKRNRDQSLIDKAKNKTRLFKKYGLR